jgi:hypothetical protein
LWICEEFCGENLERLDWIFSLMLAGCWRDFLEESLREIFLNHPSLNDIPQLMEYPGRVG